ncbi:MAG: sodium:proton antiporter [Omnitrophica bacterium RIFCSPHIGHO2_02_FULL_51_18]|nr:MAG: sodium:proton antiporter [Omnitrophica bacterium RIFCSPHIGHO2_02_FULL_51_18]
MIAELIWTLPFAALLASIALFPLLNKHWWDKNYPWVSLGLGAVVVFHILFQLKNPEMLLGTAHEYFSFIALIGSLFIVAGGIHINVKGEATPPANCVFLLIGSLLSNFLGTTGASMVMIRPWIRMNKYRLTAFHIVFFIFLVSNVGGALTPIGDPPLFLGYLKGIPFFWVLENVFFIWLAVILALLGIFFVMDSLNYKKAPRAIRAKETGRGEEWKFMGIHNVFFLLMIIGAVFIHEPIFLREALMILAAILSYKTTSKQVHESNDFNFGPIKEVAILFMGIFATMTPALEWLEHHADKIGIHSPGQFFWGSGILSGVLDNAPTYLSFLSAAIGLFGHASVESLLRDHGHYVKAISVASVFFGAMTYIGNGPNFLVKSIADQAKIKTPSFLGYVFKYSLPILLPIFACIWYFFFR